MAAREELRWWYGSNQRAVLASVIPVQATRGSFRQGSIEPENMMIKHEIQTAAPQLWQQPADRFGKATMVAWR